MYGLFLMARAARRADPRSMVEPYLLPEQLLAQADRCRRLAESSTDPDLRTKLQAMAKEFETQARTPPRPQPWK